MTLRLYNMKVVFVSSICKYFYSCWFHFWNIPSMFCVVLTCSLHRICQNCHHRCGRHPYLTVKSWNLERSLTSLVFVPITLQIVSCIPVSFLLDQTKSLIGGGRGVLFPYRKSGTSGFANACNLWKRFTLYIAVGEVASWRYILITIDITYFYVGRKRTWR